MPNPSPQIIQLHPNDNIAVLGGSLDAGELFEIGGDVFTASYHLTLGHKLACRAIKSGETILKYGVPIGVATKNIAKGAHAHIHNIRSNYTDTHTLNAPQIKS